MAREKPKGAEWKDLERKESHLWRLALWLLALLALALAAASWEQLRTLGRNAGLEAVPIGIVVLISLFVLYAWKRKREADELRAYLSGLREGSSEGQLERLVEVISRSQQGYRELIDSFDDSVFSVLLDGTIQAGNRRLSQLLGRDFAGLIGSNLQEFLEQPRLEQVQPFLADFLERRYWSGVVPVRLKRADAARGELRYFRVALHAILKDGHVVGASGLARDTTAERESETRFTDLFQTLREGVYFSTPDGRLLDANPALVRMLGYDSREELLRISVNDLYWRAADRPQVLQELEQGAELRDREITLRRKDGTPIVCLDTSMAIRNPDGQVLRYQGTLVDITPRKEIEERLRREQEFARSLADCFPDLIVVLDTEGRYSYVSPRVGELLGYTAEELLGQSLGGRMRPADQQAVRQLFQALVSGSRRYGTIEYETTHKDGSWRTFRATASPLYDSQGNITGVVASARDVTEVKRLEQQVLQSEKLAAMGQMIAGVAHELNNPLTAILGVSDLLREPSFGPGAGPARPAESAGGRDEATRRHLELMHQQARRAARIVQNLLTFARPPAPNKARVNLVDLLERALRLSGGRLQEDTPGGSAADRRPAVPLGHITAEVEPAPGLPFVVGDPNQLMQVFVNLLINAEQAIRSVRESGTIRIRFGQDPQWVWVRLEDDGPGILPEVLPKIFDPFFTTKRPDRGTGLGLSICLAIVREHRGRIEAEPRPGGGTAFTVWLPVHGEPSAESAAAGREGSGKAEQPESGRAGQQAWRVLVVDDEENIRELVTRGLAEKGYHVECAGSGAEAQALLARQQAGGRCYDAVLCDLHLPGFDPRGWLERLQDGPGRPAVLLMTGDLVAPAEQARLEENGVGVLHKPFHLDELTAIVARLLETASPRVS